MRSNDISVISKRRHISLPVEDILYIQLAERRAVIHASGGKTYETYTTIEELEQMLGSDLLLFSYPLYCYGMPAGLKNLIARTLPLSSMAMKEVNGRYIHVDQRDYSHLRYLMICGCGFPNSRRNFEPAVRQFELLFPNNHTILTVPESPMFNAPEAAVVTVPRLELVRRAGRQYAQTGQIDTALLAEIGSPMIPEELYAKIVNGTAE